MTRSQILFLINELEMRFPELITDEPMSGGDTVEALSEWYENLRDSLAP